MTPLRFIKKDRGDADIMISFAARGKSLCNHYELLSSYCLYGAVDLLPYTAHVEINVQLNKQTEKYSFTLGAMVATLGRLWGRA